MAQVIRMPDGSTKTADELRAAAANNEVGSGPGGSAINKAIESGTYTDPYTAPSGSAGAQNSGSSGAGANAKGKATTGATKGDPGTTFGFAGGGTGNKETDRTRSIYEGRDNESLSQWMQRVFRQGTRDYGGTLSPSSDNPYAGTPYAQWFQNRYQDVAPANFLLGKLLQNTGLGEDFAPGIEGQMKNFFATGEGRGFGTGTQGAQSNLGSLNDLMNSFNAGNTGGLSPDQVAALGGLNDDPRLQMAMVNAQLSGGIGANPLSQKYVSNMGSRMLNDYYDDIVGQDPSTHGTFLQNLMRKLNMA